MKIRRIKGLTFYFDTVIRGFSVTYTDFKENEFKKEHILYKIYNWKTKELIGKESLKSKSIVLPEWDYIVKIVGEATSHINFLKIKTKLGKIINIGKRILNAKQFKMIVYEGERAFACFGVLAPVRGQSERYGLITLGLETRILSPLDKLQEESRAISAIYIQKQWRKTCFMRNIIDFVNNKIIKRRRDAAIVIQT